MARKRLRKASPAGEAALSGRMPAAEPPPAAGLSSPEEELNRQIVRMLQADGRLAFNTIAEKLGVSEGTVRNRVAWMKEARMLQIVAIADPTAIRYRANAMLGIKVASRSTPAAVAERLERHAEVVYAIWVSGRYDLLVELVTDSDEGFRRFVQDECYGQPDIAGIEIMTALATYKNQYLLKNRLSD